MGILIEALKDIMPEKKQKMPIPPKYVEPVQPVQEPPKMDNSEVMEALSIINQNILILNNKIEFIAKNQEAVGNAMSLILDKQNKMKRVGE